MNHARFDLEGVRFTGSRARLGLLWSQVQDLRRTAYTEALLHRPRNQIGTLIQDEGYLTYPSSVLIPLSSGRLYAGQKFAKPTLAQAHIGERLVGFACMADNTSGSYMKRTAKMHGWTPDGLARRYAWMREFVVDPAEQRRGIATALGLLMLSNRSPEQPMSAYTWAENPGGEALVRAWDMQPGVDEETGGIDYDPVEIFGTDATPAQQARWSGQTVGGFRGHVMSRMAVSGQWETFRNNTYWQT